MEVEKEEEVAAAHREVPLDLVDDNPFNPRSKDGYAEVPSLRDSMAAQGLLSPVQLRAMKGGRFQLVYGHRRVRAARALNWKTIRAEVVSRSDREMLEAALVENLQREELSDYQKGLAFKQLNEQFGATLEDIARIVGYSREHVNNFVRMTALFDEEFLEREPSLRKELDMISEHHARLLLQIHEPALRANMLSAVVSDKLSVRELQRIIQRFRAWFGDATVPKLRAAEGEDSGKSTTRPSGSYNNAKQSRDFLEIRNKLVSLFSKARISDFDDFINLRDLESYSIYDDFPPFERVRGPRAIEKQREWFYLIAPNLTANVRDIDIAFLGEVALATLYVDYRRKQDRTLLVSSRGTVVFVRKSSGWRIVHEHWSNLDQEKKAKAVLTK